VRIADDIEWLSASSDGSPSSARNCPRRRVRRSRRNLGTPRARSKCFLSQGVASLATLGMVASDIRSGGRLASRKVSLLRRRGESRAAVPRVVPTVSRRLGPRAPGVPGEGWESLHRNSWEVFADSGLSWDSRLTRACRTPNHRGNHGRGAALRA
jgi:hypothetical protein